MYLVSNYI